MLSCKVQKFKFLSWVTDRSLIITTEYIYLFDGRGKLSLAKSKLSIVMSRSVNLESMIGVTKSL